MTHIYLRNGTMRRTVLTTSVAAIASVSLLACGATDETAEVAATLPDATDVSAEANMVADPAEEVTLTDSGTEDQLHSAAESDAIRQAESHVHGAADLAMALDGATISIELESPLYNLVGFEHAPETEAQISIFESAESRLSQPAMLFQFNPESACAASPVDRIDLMPEAADHHDDDHSHDEDHAHEDDHSHDEDRTHSHDDDHDHAHKDALLSYSFVCQSPDQLQWVDIGLFDSFDNLAEIDLVYLGPAQQISTNLTPGSGRIQLVD